MSEILTRQEIIDRLQNELPELRRHFGVERIAIYGSFASDTATDQSDVDVIVQLVRPLGLAFFSLAARLEQIFDRNVDLITFDSLNRGAKNPRKSHIAHEIERSLIYV